MVESTVASAIDLAVKRLDEEIEQRAPFSESRAVLVDERNVLRDSQRRILAVLDPRT